MHLGNGSGRKMSTSALESQPFDFCDEVLGKSGKIPGHVLGIPRLRGDVRGRPPPFDAGTD